MREGAFTFYRVQHKDSSGGWCDSALDHFLFSELEYHEKRGARGDAYREVIRPQHECWQRTGVEGFLRFEDATLALDTVTNARGDHEFRLVRVHISKSTEVVGDARS